MKKLFRILILVIVVLALVGLLAHRKAQLGQAEAYGMRPVSVRVAEVTQIPMESAHEYLGIAEAWRRAVISSRISARIKEVLHDEGDLVQTGETLIRLDERDIQAESRALQSQIQGAKAMVSSLETNLSYWSKENKRDGKLAQQGVISPSAAESTQNRFAAAQASLQGARDNQEALGHRLEAIRNNQTYATLTAPFDGVVTARDTDPGDLATPGKPLMVVEDRDKLKLAFDAPQEDLSQLKEGLPVLAQVGDTPLPLVVTHLYPSFNAARMIHVEVAVPEAAGLRIGEFIPLSVVFDRHEQAVTVPRESLMESPTGDTAVFVIKNGKLETRTVKKLMESGGRVEVSGVEPGEQVVTSTFLGWATLASGLSVEVIR